MVETSTPSDSRPRGALKGLPPAVVRLGWVSFLTDVSSDMIFPLLPAFLATIAAAPALALGWIEGVAEATASVLKIVSGRLADRARAKKPLVLLGYGVSSLARPLVALAPAWGVVLAIRFLDRVGKGVRTAPRDTLLAAAAPPERRGAAFGLHRAFDNAGAVFGPLLAAGILFLAPGRYRLVFALAAIPAILSLAVLFFGVTEKMPEPAAAAREARKEEAGDAAHAPLPAAYWRAVAVVALFTLAASSDAFLLLKARQAGVPVAAVPLLWALFNALKSASARIGGGLSDRLGRRPLIGAAWLLYAATYAAFAFVATPLAMVLVISAYAFTAAAEGAERALVADLVPAARRGRGYGWLHGLTGAAALVASAGFGLLWYEMGPRAAFLVGAAPALLAFFCVPLLPKSPRAA